MIRKDGNRFSLATNARRLRGDHAQTKRFRGGHIMGRIRSLLIPGVDKRLLIKDATKVMPDLARRRFISGGASLGALTLLTGCDVLDSDSADRSLAQISKFNDAVLCWMFKPEALAPTFPESAFTKPFPFNGYYDVDDAPEIDGKDWKLE